jgi:hypothetical protein
VLPQVAHILQDLPEYLSSAIETPLRIFVAVDIALRSWFYFTRLTLTQQVLFSAWSFIFVSFPLLSTLSFF